MLLRSMATNDIFSYQSEKSDVKCDCGGACSHVLDDDYDDYDVEIEVSQCIVII